MRCSKRGFLCISFSLFFTVASYAASSAFPGSDGFPPFPPDQEMQEEDFSTSEQVQEPEYEAEAEEEAEQEPEQEDFPKGPHPQTHQPPHQPPKDADKFFYYRGNRTYSEELPLEVKFIRCLRGEGEQIILMIMFNQSVNPRSINHESFLIDDTELPENIRFSFNRKGDTIRMIIIQEEEEFIVTVQNVSTFTGECIEPVELLAKVED